MRTELVKKINRYFHDEEGRFFAGRHGRRIRREQLFYEDFFRRYAAAGRRRLRVLDIGSGTGLVGSALPNDRYELILTDISSGMLNVARDNLKSKWDKYVACDAENLPFKNGAFDIITCNAAMHHFPSVDNFAREMQRALTPEGALIIGFETNRKFWTTWPISLLYRAAALLRRNTRRNDPDYEFVCKRVNQRLIKEKAIACPMRDEDIFTLVDIHSPNAGGKIDYSKGFDALELTNGVFKDYKAAVFYHYDEDSRVLGALNRSLFPQAAPQFSLALEKRPRTKVLFVSVHLNYGGAEVGLLTTLKNIDRDRFDCTVVSIEKKGVIGEAIERLGFKVIYLDARARLFNIGLVMKMIGVLRKEKPDILHTSLFYANFFGRAAALFRRPAVILTEERSMYTEKRFYHVAIDRALSAITDKIVVCSDSVLRFTVNQEGIAGDKFRLMYNAVDTERFNVSETRDALRDGYGFSKEDFIIGSVGTLIPKKGHRFLIEALSGLINEAPRIKLLMIGAGESAAELTGFAKARGVNERVVFLGSREDVPQLMKSMDVFVLPSLQEGFPRTIVEAMYSGLPVIASDISGVPEIISDGENGLLVPPGDVSALAGRISALYRDPDLRKRLGENARKRVENGCLPRDYVPRLEGLYSELLKGNKHNAA